MGCHHRVSNGNDRLHFDVDYAADLLCNILFPPYHWRHNQSINQFILNIDQVQMPPFMPLQSNMTRRQCANSGWMSRLWVWLMPTSTSNMATKHHSRDYKTHTNSYKFYHRFTHLSPSSTLMHKWSMIIQGHFALNSNVTRRRRKKWKKKKNRN